MPARKKPGGAASVTATARPSSADAPGSMSSALLAAAEGSSTDSKATDAVDGKPAAKASEPKEAEKAQSSLSEAKTLPATPQAKSDESASVATPDVAPSSDTEVEAAVEEKKADEAAPAAPAADQSIFVRVFGRTDVGQVREHNEDNFLVADLSKGSRGLMETDRLQLVGERGTVLGVCDGMGGAAAGEVASQLAVDIVYQRMLAGDPPKDRDDVASRLVAAIESAGNRIFAEAKADRTRRGMGTTATIAGLIDGYLFLGQVGDSRGYLLRGDRLVQVTRDQSLVNQLIEAGQLTEEEAETFEHNNIILQALGTADTVQVDLTYVDLRKGDTLLLCSDGLSGMVRNDEIREVLSTFEDPLEACRELTDRANQAGGHDNVTVVVAKFEGPGLVDPTPEEIAGLKYRKYELPELTTRSGDGAPHGIRSSMRPGKAGPDIEVGYDEYDGDLANDSIRAEDPVELPREQAPSWIVTMMIVSAVTCVVVVGYYLLR
ncbi:MAG TPA: Stp1/IreP family PP2C-type Ser/Thr phosphatase [Polyangiaceae bacterium]|nr:Stp1/IreP family PP2C-type Ser/Thr phosphatase [Polyangiaceae bacterium]